MNQKPSIRMVELNCILTHHQHILLVGGRRSNGKLIWIWLLKEKLSRGGGVESQKSLVQKVVAARQNGNGNL